MYETTLDADSFKIFRLYIMYKQKRNSYRK